MPEGALYCEKCGRDIHMVPDFEPELESNLQESLRSIADVVKGVSHGEKKGFGKRSRGAVLSTVLGMVAGVLLIAVILAGAVLYYNRAAEADAGKPENMIALAQSYQQQGNKLEYEYWLEKLRENDACSQEQLAWVYGALVELYRERGAYQEISELLLSCEDASIRNAYRGYLASPPHFNYAGGVYDRAIPLKLVSDTTGKIYYTLDGSEPGADSELYSSPILLENGVTTVKAVVINEYGVISDVAEASYQIVAEIAGEPTVSVLSGVYRHPMMIEVVNFSDRKVYYTTDGSAPGLEDTLYTAPISMPLGKSQYAFAYVEEDGTCGEVAIRNYELELDAKVSVSDATGLVSYCMMLQGKIKDLSGYFSGASAARYLYECIGAVTIEGRGDFYIIAEVLRNEQGHQSKTGSVYGVNTQKKECYKLNIDENNNYYIVEILIDSPQ